MSLTAKVGIFGGTFNPLHNAHLIVAQTALTQFGLTEVVFVPSGIPPHKEVAEGVDREDRYAMVKEGILPYHSLSVSRIEIDRAGPSYTIDTIRALKEIHPEGICFIVGADLLLQIETWKEPQELLQSVPFIIAPRAGVAKERFSVPPFDRAEVHFLRMNEVDLSSTWVRKRLKQGRAIEGCVPHEVTAYIEEHSLYRYREPVKIAEQE